MHKCLQNGWLTPATVSKIIFTCIFFFSACTTKKPEINAEERRKIQSFLDQFLFVEGAVYSLFGDKPISQMLIFIGSDADRAVLSEEQLETAAFVDDSITENGQVWKHFINKIPSKHFIFAERPCRLDPHHVIYSLLNIERVKEVLCKHKLDFQKKTESLFDADQVIQEFRDPQSSFWKQVLADHYLSGLLFGYGEENIAHFLNLMDNEGIENQFSDQTDQLATANKFPIPIFAISPQDKTTAHYRKQRKSIQEIYRGKDIVDVTLRRFID
jgi:hypothetical protein